MRIYLSYISPHSQTSTRIQHACACVCVCVVSTLRLYCAPPRAHRGAFFYHLPYPVVIPLSAFPAMLAGAANKPHIAGLPACLRVIIIHGENSLHVVCVHHRALENSSRRHKS